MRVVAVDKKYKDPTLNVIFDTLAQKRQCLVFVSSRASAEKVATELAAKITTVENPALSQEVLAVLGHPTKQCEKLAACVRRNVAFHHSGLAQRQKEIIEDNFRNSAISTIVCTPTLAAGVDLPAFRTILRDMKRFSGTWGMQYIPVLEYLQMAGRAGRPGKETHGESIIICTYASDAHELKERFIDGVPEPIQSKLAVEPVLRTYTLSLISSGIIRSYDELTAFFDKTFYGHQFGDRKYLASILQRVLGLLRTWGMLVGAEHSGQGTENAFMGADTLQQLQQPTLRATPLGRRVSELYLDPLTAYQFIKGLEKCSTSGVADTFQILQLCTSSLEARPLFPMAQKDMDGVMQRCSPYLETLLVEEPSMFDPHYKSFLDSLKTTLVLFLWMQETEEHTLLEQYGTRPGELKAKIDALTWLLGTLQELARLNQYHTLLTPLEKIKTRLEYGVKEELLPLIALRQIGRVRARKLADAGFLSLADLRKASLEQLTPIIGPALAKTIKDNVGDTSGAEVSGQQQLG